jgi:dimethylaniline monooxygenase (N-oxide forming)
VCVIDGIFAIVFVTNDIKQFLSLSIPKTSPLRRTHPLFWGIRINDEGAGRTNGFYDLVNKGRIDLISPARAVSFGIDRKSIVLNDGRVLKTDAVVLATGFRSSWDAIFDRMFTVSMKLSF